MAVELILDQGADLATAITEIDHRINELRGKISDQILLLSVYF